MKFLKAEGSIKLSVMGQKDKECTDVLGFMRRRLEYKQGLFNESISHISTYGCSDNGLLDSIKDLKADEQSSVWADLLHVWR